MDAERDGVEKARSVREGAKRLECFAEVMRCFSYDHGCPMKR